MSVREREPTVTEIIYRKWLILLYLCSIKPLFNSVQFLSTKIKLTYPKIGQINRKNPLVHTPSLLSASSPSRYRFIYSANPLVPFSFGRTVRLPISAKTDVSSHSDSGFPSPFTE